jgi:N-acetylneuraminic acid mutarotase
MFPAMLALSLAVLTSCNERATEPETAGEALPVPALAVVSNTWIPRADLPSIERLALTSAVVPNAAGQSILYAIGGITALGGSLGKVQAYNAATNAWTYKASLPIAVYRTNGAGVINRKIYVSGGVTRDKFFRRDLYMYDPASDTWTPKQDIPSCCAGTWGGLTGVIDNQLYVVTCEEAEDCYIDLRPLSLLRYDPATNQWTQLASSPPQLKRPMGGVIGGKLYVTGLTGGPDSRTRLAVYDPATNQWTVQSSIPRPRWDGASVVVDRKLYLIGGFQQDADGTVRKVRGVNVYDPATNSWTTKAPLPTARAEITASRVFVNGEPRIEAVGGERPGNNLQYIP